jgi:hypothetical protein
LSNETQEGTKQQEKWKARNKRSTKKIKYQETKCGWKARKRKRESEAERKEEDRKIKCIENKK